MTIQNYTSNAATVICWSQDEVQNTYRLATGEGYKVEAVTYKSLGCWCVWLVRV